MKTLYLILVLGCLIPSVISFFSSSEVTSENFIQVDFRELNETVNITSSPSISPTPLLIVSPTRAPTGAPSKNPTTQSPTNSPTRSPSTLLPTDNPTSSPTTNNPTAIPTVSPTANPTNDPTTNPTAIPTVSPTTNPTNNPTTNPTANPTVSPTTNPTNNPTVSPSVNPTTNPTRSPTTNPTKNPTISPTTNPTSSPTRNPTQNPTDTFSPTKNPTTSPTTNPTVNPTINPTQNPTTGTPTQLPTTSPTQNPTDTFSPTFNPTTSPTENPTQKPTTSPTENPTTSPTDNPTQNPTTNPTENPTQNPTTSPTENPTTSPTKNPTQNPTTSPTKNPTENPTTSPTKNPTQSPTIFVPSDENSIGIIIGVAIPLVLVIFATVLVYTGRLPFFASPDKDNDKIETKKNAITAIDKVSFGTDGSSGNGKPHTATEPQTPENPTFRQSGEQVKIKPIIASQPPANDAYTLGMNSTTGLVGPGQVANVNVLLGKASNVVEEKTKNVKSKLGVKEAKHIGQSYDPVKEDRKAGIDVNILSSGHKMKSINNNKEARVNAMAQKARAEGVDEDIAMLDALVAANTMSKPHLQEDNDVAMLDALVAAHTPSSRSTPPTSSDKNGVKGKATTDNPGFATGRPQSEYIENLDEQRISIFRPSSWFIKSHKATKNAGGPSIHSKKSRQHKNKDIDSDI